MNNIEIKPKPLAESEAVIKSNESYISIGLWNIGNELKTIRDTKSYQEKSYQSFEEYTKSELNYSKSHTYNFITIAEKYNVQSIGRIGNFGINKLLSLAQLPEPKREDFIKTNDVEDMTTRELKAAIKAKKKAENEVKQLEDELKNQQPIIKEVIKEVIPKDYNSLKGEVKRLEQKLSETEEEVYQIDKQKKSFEKLYTLTKKQAEEYKELKSQMDKLCRTKEDFGRELKAVTELSGLVVKVDNLLKEKLSPIKYSRAISEQSDNEIVRRNLSDIVNRVKKWCNDMDDVLGNKYEYYDAEVME